MGYLNLLIEDPKTYGVTDETRVILDRCTKSVDRVFSNLFANSIRHGGKVKKIRIVVNIRGPNLVLSYEDDGIGIPADQKQRVFEKGYISNFWYR